MIHELALGEIASLAQKAAQGAGRSYGQAEDAGRAVRWLCERGYDGAGALDALLRTDPAQGQCPLSVGGYISDMGALRQEPIGPVIAPILMAPFLAQIAGDGCISVRGKVVKLLVYSDNLAGSAAINATMITLHLSAEVMPKRAFKTRAEVAPHVFQSLQSFAARTYAPATEASRMRGAGAGSSDND